MTESRDGEADSDRAVGRQDLLRTLGGSGSGPDDNLRGGPQPRSLDQAERALLHRVIGRIAEDPRWQGEHVALWPELADLIGDGTRPQVRELTYRERADIGRMIELLTAEFISQYSPHVFMSQNSPGICYPPYLAELTGGDIARLNLLARVIDARGDLADDRVVVHESQWSPPVDIPPDWDVACAPRPLDGAITWQDEARGHGRYYAAVPPDSPAVVGWARNGPASQWARPVHVLDNEQIAREVAEFLKRYRCRSPEDAGLTTADVALRYLGLPWQAAPATPAGDPAAHPAVALTDLAFPADSPGEADALRKPPACIDCHKFTHLPGTTMGGHKYQGPRRVGHHAYGAHADGSMVVYRPSMAGEITADFPYLERGDGDLVDPDPYHDGLEQALAWARKTLADHPAVDHVVILQTVQEYHGQSWKVGRHVTTIKRDNAGAAAGTGGAPGRAAGRGSHGDPAAAVAAAAHRGRTAGRRRPPPGGTATGHVTLR
jgi:hypothetical protein